MKRPEVRVLAGRWKGRRLEGGPAARPTSSRARKALFDILGDSIAGARVLDLYAGSGAVGIEAVSRGAASATLVEQDASALARGVERLGASAGEVRVLATTVGAALDALSRAGERFDVVFADPPYALESAAGELGRAGELLAAEGVFVLQRDARAPEPRVEGLTLRSRRAYGRNVFHFFGMR